MRLSERLKKLLNDPSREFSEKVFILLTLVAVVVAVVALLGDLIYGENIVEIILLTGTTVMVPVATVIAIRTKRVPLMSRLISAGLIFVILPVIFIFGGGLEGGDIPWLIFSYLYIGLVVTGMWRLVFIAVLTAVIIVLFYIGYTFPELIYPHSREIFYMDLLLGVIEVGLVCFVMTWFQNLLYIQENKRAREETRKVEELNRSQNRFFSNMSHEIRTPINSILGLNEIILRQEEATDEIKRDAGNIQGAGRMLLALINDILDFSKIKAGKMDIVPVNYSVSALLSEIVNMIWLRAEQKGLEVKLEVDPSIPTELFGDEVRIKQILVNLLNNAVKYTSEGSVTLRIEKEDVKDDQILLMFSVIDTGMGIKQDALPYLFDAFQRVDEEKNINIEGTGLGLSIVKQLVELMDGRITVNSVYTQGSTFTVTLWQIIARKEVIGDVNISSISGAGTNGKYKPDFRAPEAKLLIVDDNTMNLEVEKKLIVSTEIQVDTATSGEQALTMTQAVRYDMILMDHLMPGMDGIECMQHIRKQYDGLNNHVPIIVLTANAGSENRELYSRSGFDGYLIKPVTGRQLEEVAMTHLPASKVIRTRNKDFVKMQLNATGTYSRKIPLLISTNTTCDLPAAVLAAQQIDTIPYTIHSEGGTFYDGPEAGVDEMVRYMQSGVRFDSEPPTVEEFEKFFGQELKKAHNLIYITISSELSDEYARAMEAAKAYGNVRVFDSKNISGCLGMIVLMAQRMSAQGKSPEKIIDELESVRDKMYYSLITDGAYFRQGKSFFDKSIYNVIRILNIRTVIRIRNGHFVMGRITMGEQEACYKKYISYAFPRFAHPNTDVLIVAYSGLSADEVEKMKAQICRHCNFKNIIFQKASATMITKSGEGALAFNYITAERFGNDIGNMFITDSVEMDDDSDAKEQATVSPVTTDEYEPEISHKDIAEKHDNELNETETAEHETDAVTDEASAEDGAIEESPISENTADTPWYERIHGINYEHGLEYSGDEEIYYTVMEAFYESIDEKSEELDRYYENGEWDNYTIKVHALKSSARLVGADELADDAQALETASKDGDVGYVKSHHPAVMKEFRAFRTPLAVIFADGDADMTAAESESEDDADDETNEQFDSFLIECVYETLREGAEQKDDELIEQTLREIDEYDPRPEAAEKIKRLRAFFDSKDYAAMLKMLDNGGKV
ncbi:MAG: DegV family EDD domain-containing protein [Lachnospiraceae bacterium]|nr:DegV family EDD domain-containing protein [Lachnospiraceae bacterium]